MRWHISSWIPSLIWICDIGYGIYGWGIYIAGCVCYMNNMRDILGFLAGKIRGTTRVSTIKFKINGRCINKCRFCPFHNDPYLLEVKDIAYFFDMAGRKPFKHLVVNGGEPTIHPRFSDICIYLKEHCKDRMLVSLGTNLIPLSWSRGRYTNLKETIFETFHRIEVGCDDEHRNIDYLERFGPEIVEAGIKLSVNVMPEYCSEATKGRILALKALYDIKVTFTELHHYYESRPILNDTSTPCQKRARDLLINSNGDAFFCYKQEMESPLFNLFTVTREEMGYFLEQHDPQRYRFCDCCPRYMPDHTMHIETPHPQRQIEANDSKKNTSPGKPHELAEEEIGIVDGA
jgi:hypothetical protein